VVELGVIKGGQGGEGRDLHVGDVDVGVSTSLRGAISNSININIVGGGGGGEKEADVHPGGRGGRHVEVRKVTEGGGRQRGERREARYINRD